MKHSEKPGKERAALAVTLFFLTLLLSPALFIAVSAAKIGCKAAAHGYQDAPGAIARHYFSKFHLSKESVPLRSRELLADEKFLFEGRGGWNYAFTYQYGCRQRMIGKRFVSGYRNGRYKLQDGTLVNHIVKNDEALRAQVIDPAAELAGKLKSRGIPFVYLLPLFALCAQDPLLPYGAEDGTNVSQDLIARLLREKGVPVIDPRAALHQRRFDHHALAFKTDHHTRPESGLLIAGAVAEYLRQNEGFTIDESLFDSGRYETETYSRFFRGTFFSCYGPCYLEPDDFPVITPEFPTSLTVQTQTKAGEETKTGTFRETLLDLSRLESPDSDLIFLYTGFNYGLHRAVNHRAPNEKKILLIHESYSYALIPFLALACRELVSVDLRPIFRTAGPLEELIEREAPDAVILETGFLGTDLK